MAVNEKQFAGSDKKFFVVGAVGGVNTETTRESIRDNQFSWLENIQPIANGKFQALFSNGPALYTTSNPRTIVYHYPFNIGSDNYIFVVLDDGTALAVDADTGATTTVTSMAGAFYPSLLGTPALPQAAQSGNNYLIIVSGGIYGYAVWDGSLFYTSGTLTPIVTISNNGSGYSDAPSVQFFGGAGSGASAVASVANGEVTAIKIINPGSGYVLGDLPTITLVGGQTTGSGAAMTASLTSFGAGSGAVLTPVFTTSNGQLKAASVTISNAGSGYSSLTTAAWLVAGLPGHWLDGGAPTIVLTITGGTFTAATLKYAAFNSGGVWVAMGGGNPTITITDSGGGNYFVSSVAISTGGSNYSPSATIAVTTATTTANTIVGASISPVIVSGVITTSIIHNGGKYSSNVAPILTATDTAATALASISLMPFGIYGTCVETYQSRIWVGRGSTIEFSAPGIDSPFDWDVADGAGAFGSTDAFLRLSWRALKQSGSFLYLFADSSVNVISNVQTTSGITTFNNQSVSQEIGTPWANCVLQHQGGIIFSNTIGVFRLSGGNVEKISNDLDGTFTQAMATLLAADVTTQPSSALMTINNKVVYMTVMPVQGPLDEVPRTGLIMWDGQRWWIGSQVSTFTQVALQELDSVLQAWGNSTTTINKMFNTQSSSLAKTWETKMWSAEEPFTVKQVMRLYTMATDNTGGGYTFTGAYNYRREGTDIDSKTLTVTQTKLTGTGSDTANVRGNYVGFRLSTTKDDFTLIGQWLLYQEQSPMP